MDKRRRQYVPADVDLAFGNFGSKLGAKWGMEGLGCWVLFLAACKRERQQGTFTYTSEPEAWAKIGPTPSGFTLDEFFTFTGQQKKTRRTCHGRVTYVVVTSWKTWNTPKPRGENPGKSQDSSGDMFHDVGGLSLDVAPEGEGESEAESEYLNGEGEPRPRLKVVPSSIDIQIEVQRLVRVLRGAQPEAEPRLTSLANQLPLPVVARIRQSAEEHGGKGVGWAIRAFEGEIEERKTA